MDTLLELLGVDPQKVIGFVSDLIQDPGSNLTATAMLIGALSLVLLIIIIIVVIAVMGISDDEEELEEFEGAAFADEEATGPADDAFVDGPPAFPSEPAEPEVRRPLVVSAAVWGLLIVVMWAATGAVTARPEVCASCHAETSHTAAAEGDPHMDIGCVACHEAPGLLGSITYMVPIRSLHFVDGYSPVNLASGYGEDVVSRNCSSCHPAVLSGVSINEQTGVMVSHKEPLDDGAACVDCHALRGGLVTRITVGMNTCLRCHDGQQASSSCETCHAKDVGAAVRPSVPAAARQPKALIGQPDCGGCHDQRSCDSCHGTRLPHTELFMQWQHAREGAEDLWFNGGRTCGKCHTATQRSCADCHDTFPGHGTQWVTQHQYGNPTICSQSCHADAAILTGRTLCALCHEPNIQPRAQPSR